MYQAINNPVNYGGLELKNRIIFAPTTFGLSDEEYLAEMERLAKGGCAMIIIGDVPVAKSRFEKSLFDKKGFAFYQQICETAHKYGCKVCAQLHQTDTDMMSIVKCIPGMLMKKITPDQLRERMNVMSNPTLAPYAKEGECELRVTAKAATMEQAQGAYTHEEKWVLVTVLTRGQAQKLRLFVHSLDEHAFITIVNSSEIVGKGFRSI